MKRPKGHLHGLAMPAVQPSRVSLQFHLPSRLYEDTSVMITTNFDFGEWSTQTPRRAPLTDRAPDILQAQQRFHSSPVFPSPRDGIVLSDAADTAFLRRTQAPSQTSAR